MSVRKRVWTLRRPEKDKKGQPVRDADGTIRTKEVPRTGWVVDYTDGSGKRRYKQFKTKTEADAYHDRVRVDVRAGVHVADAASVTVAEAGALWIKAGERAGLERTTLDGRRRALKLHIVPLIGATKLTALTVPAVRAFQDRLRDGDPSLPLSRAGRPRPTPENLPPAALRRSEERVRRVTSALGSLLADAQERGLVSRNVVREMTSRGRGTAARHRERLRYGVDIPTMEEVAAILAAVAEPRFADRWRPFFVTAIFTGLRASELRGLRWADVDLAKGVLHVRQRADRYLEIGSPKSGAGHRTVPLPALVANTLREWKLRCPKSDLDLVFPTGTGKPEHHPNIVNRGWHPLQLAAGVTAPSKVTHADGRALPAAKYGGLHALRHWFASWCINRKADGGLELSPKIVQQRLGHSSIGMTMDVYGHLFPQADEAEALATAVQSLLAINGAKPSAKGSAA